MWWLSHFSNVWQRLTDTRSWTMQCRISMYWYSSQQLTTVVSSGFCCFCHPAAGRPSLWHPGPLSFHHERCDDTPRESTSLSCSDKAGKRWRDVWTFQLSGSLKWVCRKLKQIWPAKIRCGANTIRFSVSLLSLLTIVFIQFVFLIHRAAGCWNVLQVTILCKCLNCKNEYFHSDIICNSTFYMYRKMIFNQKACYSLFLMALFISPKP